MYVFYYILRIQLLFVAVIVMAIVCTVSRARNIIYTRVWPIDSYCLFKNIIKFPDQTQRYNAWSLQLPVHCTNMHCTLLTCSNHIL